MKYTSRLKIAMICDVLSGAGMIWLCLNHNNISFPSGLAVLAVLCSCWFGADLYAHNKWHRLWALPTAHTVIYYIVATIVLFGIIVLDLWDYSYAFVVAILTCSSLVTDIRYYRNAVRYGMDDLSGIEDLIEKHPESAEYLSDNIKQPIQK